MASDCCGANIQDHGGTGEGLCTECWEHCSDVGDDDYDRSQDDFIESINPNIYDMICGADRASVRKALYNLKMKEGKKE